MQSATIVARHFYWQEVAYAKGLSLSAITPVIDSILVENGDTLLYVFNIPANQGFVVVSGQDNVIPVLAYGTTGQMDMANLNPGVKLLLYEYTQQILWNKQNNIPAPQDVMLAWNDLLATPGPVNAVKAIVGPLVTTTWNQGCNYNHSCPTMTGGPCNKAQVGCVAVTMGQIMKYWNFPPVGYGSHSYTHATLGTISATFNLQYNWTGMPNALSTTTTHVDELLSHCGVSLNMDYGPGESSSYTSDMEDALEDHFYYQTTASYKERSNYTTANWRNLLIAEHNANRPVAYRGSQNNVGGHSWTVDGYNNNAATIYFHMNWGWGGNADGWFSIDNFAAGGYNFSVGQACLIGIQPKQTNLTFLSSGYGMSFINNNLSIYATAYNTGAAPSRAVKLGYFLISGATNLLFDTDDVPILSPSYTSAQGAVKTIYNSMQYPNPGVYSVGVFVDYLGEENNESNESDNQYVFPNTITVNCAPPLNVNASDGTYSDRVYVSWSSVTGASYYKVYRNVTNSTSGATALTGWQMSTFYQDFNALPGSTYYYFVQASTSAAGTYVSDYSSGNSGYVLITNLSDDVTQSVTSDPQYYQLLNATNYWYAVGIRPNVATEDWDIYMYSDATMTTSLASSTQGSGRVDVIVVDGNHTPSANKYIKADRYSGSGNATIEYENAGDLLTLNTTHSFSWRRSRSGWYGR